MKTCLQIHNDYLIPGGETNSVKLIAECLEKNGYRVIRYYKDNNIIKESNFNKLQIGIKSLYNRTTIHEIKEILNKYKIDFALIHNVSPIISNSVYDVLSRKKIPIIKYIQNYNLLCLNGALDQKELCLKCQAHPIYGVHTKCYKNSSTYSFIKLLQKKIFDHFFLNKITAFIAISDFIKQKHIDFGINPNKLYTIHHFINNKPNSVINDYSTNKENEYYLYMGRLSKEKGLLTLFNTFKELSDVKLKVMGSGELENKLKIFVELNKLSNIEFLGYCVGEKKENIIKQAKAIIVPSEWDEPFGRIVIESYQYGTPVIASNKGGLPELIDNNKTGLIFQNSNQCDLKSKITLLNNLNKNEYNNLRINCINSASKNFSSSSYIKKFNLLIESLKI